MTAGNDYEAEREPEASAPDGERPDRELWAAPEEFAEGAARWASRVLKQWSIELHPILGQFRYEKVSDLPSPVELTDVDHDLASHSYRPIRVAVEATVDFDDVLEFDVPAVLAQLLVVADERGRQLTSAMLGLIRDTSEEYGHAVDAGGRDFGDVLIEALEQLEIRFDESDDPVLPTLLMHPNTAAKLEGKSLTPDQEKRMAEVIARKREEHRASQRRSDLP